MSGEVVIRVPQTPLPRVLIESHEYQDLPSNARDALLAHVRYVQEIPLKLGEWLADGDPAELEELMHRVDLDISINLRVPGADESVSPWIIQRSWVASSKPLASFLEHSSRAVLDQPAPVIGASLSDIRGWVRDMADGLSGLLDGFFSARTYDHAIAHLVAVYVLLAAVKLGFGRIGLQFPK